MTIGDRQKELDQLCADVFPADRPAVLQTARRDLNETEAELVGLATRSRGGDKFKRLWDGDAGDYGNDASRADAALVRRLLWWSGGNVERTDSLFRQSGLMRPKWDEKRGETTYGRRTIERVRAKMDGFRRPPPRLKWPLSSNGVRQPPPAATRDAAAVTGREDPVAGSAPTGFRYDPITSAVFDAGNYELRWLVKRMFVEGMPGVIGGPQKVLKTSVVVDLVLSLATGRPFLGVFDVYRPVCTAILSGESGAYVLRETARRVCRAKGISLADADVLWSFDLPQLANPVDVAELVDGLREQGARVAVIDPLYLTLLAGVGADGPQASNLFQTGPLLLGVARACLAAGVTPLLVHHTTKPSGRKGLDGEALDLTDLAYSGIAEFARQWLLLWRRAPFNPQTGRHDLMMTVGGSAGQSGLWFLDVTEGVLRDDFGGREWSVTVTPFGEGRQRAGDAKAERRRQEQEQRDKADDDRLVKTIDGLAARDRLPVYTTVRDLCGFNSGRMTRAVERLATAGVVTVDEVEVPTGKKGGKARRTAKVVRRPAKGVGTVGTTDLLSGQSGECECPDAGGLRSSPPRPSGHSDPDRAQSDDAPSPDTAAD